MAQHSVPFVILREDLSSRLCSQVLRIPPISWHSQELAFSDVAWDYIPALLVVLCFKLYSKYARNERDPSANWIIIGVLVSIVGLIVQAIPFGDPEGWINNNSVFHIVQMFALHCYYNGARYMRDI